MKKVALIFLLSICVAHAKEHYLSIALSAEEIAKKRAAIFMQEAKNVNKNRQALTTIYKEDAQIAKRRGEDIIQKYYQTHSQSKNEGGVLIFVSFSMPKSSIEAYMRDAKRIDAKIIIRGLISNSFQETLKITQEMVKTSGGAGFELNPPAFKRFSINTVPAIVVLSSNNNCLSKEICDIEEFDVVKGDISLEEGLKQISERGSKSSIAFNILKKYRGDA